MSTRSSGRNIFPPLDNPELTIRRRSRSDPTLLNNSEMAAEGNDDLPVPDLRTMEELCQPSLNGQGGPIAPIAIQATNFALKNDMIQQVQNSCQFHGLPGDDANMHLNKFLHVTQSIKVNEVTDDALRLYLFFHSLTHHATAWFDRLLRNSITTFEQMAKMFLGKYFPPSMVTKLRKEITNFRANQGHNQPPAYQALVYQASVHPPQISQPQVVTTNKFTNFMKANDAIIKNMQTNMTSLTNLNLEIKNMFGQFRKMNTASSSGSGTLPGNTITNPKEDLKGITTRKGTAYPRPTILTTTSSSPVVKRETKATKETVNPTNNKSTKDVQPLVFLTESPILNSEPVNSPITKLVASPVSALKPNLRPSIPYPSRLHVQKLHDKANDQREKFFQIFKDLNFNISFADALILMPKFGPSIKSLLTNKDKISLADLDASINLMPLSMWNKLSLPNLSTMCMTLKLTDRLISHLVRVVEDVFIKVGTFHFPADFVVVDFNADPRVPLILGRSFLKTRRALIPVFEGELTLRVVTEAITFNLDRTSRYSANYNDMTANRIDIIDMACKEDILLLEAFLNDDPSLPPPNQGNYLPEVRKKLKICEAKSDKSSIDEPPVVELKDLPPHLEYAFLEGDDKLPVIIAKDLSMEEKTTLIMVLKLHKQAIAWKLSDIKGIDPEFHTHKILMEEDFEPTEISTIVFSMVSLGISKFPSIRKIKKNHIHCPYGTFAYLRMPFGLSNAPGTSCLFHLEKMLKRCEDTNLCLNWEKSHFMVKEGIVFGHKIYKEWIEVDKAKADVIAKLPHPTIVKGIRSFLGHAGFYRRKLTEDPILIAPDWDMPFELMCDARDFAIGTVLGQRQSSEGVYLARKPLKSLRLAIINSQKVTIAQITQPESIPENLKIHTEGFCPSVFIFSASLGNH
nr:hypothetical protein [Tanacetum cinerariifolium]